ARLAGDLAPERAGGRPRSRTLVARSVDGLNDRVARAGARRERRGEERAGQEARPRESETSHQKTETFSAEVPRSSTRAWTVRDGSWIVTVVRAPSRTTVA